MSLDEVAQRAGVNPSHLAAIERGEVPSPRAKTIGSVAEALGIEVEDLYALQERLDAPKATSPRRDDPEVLTWLSDHRASWGLLSEEEFSDRVLAQRTMDAPSEAERVERIAVEIDLEQRRIMGHLRREFTNPSGLFPEDRQASAYRELQRDLRQHYRLMTLALANYAVRVLSGEESEEAFTEALAESAA